MSHARLDLLRSDSSDTSPLAGDVGSVFALSGAISGSHLQAAPALPTAFLTQADAIRIVPPQLSGSGTGLTPTVSQLLNAADNEYEIASVPAGLTPFLVDGSQMRLSDSLTGAQARVWLTPAHQVIVAYQGSTGGENAILNPINAVTGVFTDFGVALRQTPTAYRESAQFARDVIVAAGKQGIGPSDIFLTGHSLGGEESSYAAQQTGLGGIAFESTGIPNSPTAVGNGANFVSIVTDGDVFANYGSDIAAEQPIAPAYVPHGGTFAHWGQLIQIGSQADQDALISAVKDLTTPGLFWAVKLPGVAAKAVLYTAEFHPPGTQAADLGVTLDPAQLTGVLAVQHGPVLPVADLTIPQFQQYALTHPTAGA